MEINARDFLLDPSPQITSFAPKNTVVVVRGGLIFFYLFALQFGYPKFATGELKSGGKWR